MDRTSRATGASWKPKAETSDYVVSLPWANMEHSALGLGRLAEPRTIDILSPGSKGIHRDRTVWPTVIAN